MLTKFPIKNHGAESPRKVLRRNRLKERHLREFDKRWPILWDKIVTAAMIGLISSNGVPLDISSRGELRIREAIIMEFRRLFES